MGKIYLVKRDESVSGAVYDVYNNFVVVAKTPTEARMLCMDEAADEGEHSWVAAKVIKLGESKDTRPRIVLGDFNAG